jgi:predicted site-specific integrase-resolvase
MNLATWAGRNGVARVTAYRWFGCGVLPVPAQRVGRLILVDDAAAWKDRRSRTAVYARVWSADQMVDLDRQVARVTAWATVEQIPVDQVVTEVGSALDGHRRQFLALRRDPAVTRIVVEHRDGSAGLVVNTSKPPLPPRAENWSWWIHSRSTTTWCAR